MPFLTARLSASALPEPESYPHPRAIAHTTQFAPVGWRYAQHYKGVQMLSGGGSLVTRVSPDKKDFSIVIEKMDTKNSVCARGSNPGE